MECLFSEVAEWLVLEDLLSFFRCCQWTAGSSCIDNICNGVPLADKIRRYNRWRRIPGH